MKLGRFQFCHFFFRLLFQFLCKVLVVDVVFLQSAQKLRDVHTHTVARTFATFSLFGNQQPAGHCEVHCLCDVVPCVETRMVGSSSRNDELSRSLDSASQLDALFE